MFEKIRNLLSPVKAVVNPKKIFSVFIGGAPSCACTYFYHITKDLKNANPFLWHDPEHSLLPAGSLENGFFLYAHGDPKQLEPFYRNRSDQKILLTDQVWEKFSVNPKLTYFHVCYGSQILHKNKFLRSKFPYWVSYTGEITVLRSQKIKELEEFYIELSRKIYEAALQAQSPMDFKFLIAEAHRSMKNEIKLKPRLSSVLVATIGANMGHLAHFSIKSRM